MTTFFAHFRNKLLAGAFAAVPIAIVVYAAIWIESHTKDLATPFGIQFPGMGFLIALAGIYLLGLVVTSVLGQVVLRQVNRVLEKVPGVSFLYRAWKDLLVISPDKAGMYHQVVMVPTGRNGAQLG